jgi:hypothetical protein
MDIRRQIFANTHPTKRGDVVDAQSLARVAKQFEQGAGEIDIEHDPRRAPVGRMVAARLVDLPDGHSGLEGTLELFDDGDYQAPYPLGGILLRKRDRPNGERILAIDEHLYPDNNAREIAKELAQEIQAELQFFSKNAVDPPTWLIIAFGCAMGSIATSFLSEFGKDVYKAARKKLLSLLKQAPSKADKLLVFEVSVGNDEGFAVWVILTNPSEDELARFLNATPPSLEQEIRRLAAENKNIARVAYSFEADSLRGLYIVRKDGLPFFSEGGGDPPRLS